MMREKAIASYDMMIEQICNLEFALIRERDLD